MQFYEIYKELCKSVGKSECRVAEEVGTHKTSITYWKKGNTPTKKILESIAEYFNVSVDYLLGKENTLSKDEQDLITGIRKLPVNKRKEFIESIRKQIDLFYK